MRPVPGLFLLALFALVPLTAQAQTVQITSNITTNTTWGPTGTVVGDIFWVRNTVSISNGVTLTIEPGVIVKFDLTRGMVVNGTLAAMGGPGNEIVITSIRDDVGGDTNGDGNASVPNASDWWTLTFPDAAPDASTLDYCDIRNAGYSNTAALTFVSNSSSVTNSVIRKSYFGVDCQGTASPTLSNTSIEASTLTPIVLDFTATPLLSSLVFSSANNGYDAFGVRGGTLSTAATLPQRGATVGASPITNVTYVLLSTLTILASGNLSIDPGVVIKPINGGITVNSGGQLTMNGTGAPGDTITITSIHDDNLGQPGDTNNNGSLTAPNPGDWTRLIYNQGSTGSLQYCRLKFGSNAATQGMVEMTNNAIPISNSLLSDASHGVAAFGTSTPAISDVAIQNCTSTPVYMSVSANPVFTNVSFLANAITALGLRGEAIGVDSRIAVRNVAGYDNITYYLMNGAITMQNPAILTIDPGIVIKNQLNGGGFVIDGGLVADGKVDSLIVFTSERDDLYGNPADTNGDGTTTVPAQANWTYVYFTSTSNDAVSKLDYCRLTYGAFGPFDGYATQLRITNASPAVTNSVISNAVYGIRIEGASAPLIDACTIGSCQYAPIVMSVQSNPDIATNNTFPSNGYNALALLGETISQNSRLRYRPGVGSPTFAYLPTGTINVASGVALSIDPQVVIKPSGSFTVFSVSGALNVVGTDAGPGRIVFTSRRDDNPLYGGDTTPTDATTPNAGDWGSIQFNDTSVDGSCVVRNCLFQFGGSQGQEQGVLTTVSASPRFAANEFFQNVTTMTFKGASQPTVDSTAIFNSTQIPITWSLVSDPQFPNPNNITFANNTYTILGIVGETVAQNVTTRVRSLGGISNMAYAPTGTITIDFGAKWTIQPGIVIKFGRIFVDPVGTGVVINGALSANGKPDSLIVFTAIPDDAFGGDTKGDGALTLPVAASWVGFQFNPVRNDTATVINHCRFRYGGYNNTGTLRFTSAGPTVSNSAVTLGNSYGVLIEGNSTPTFTDSFVDSCTNVPVQMSLVSEPVFNNLQFLGNTYTALGVIGESIAQDVLWKIRPVSGRNNMPYLLQSQLTTGLGATVNLQPGLIVKGTSSGSILIQRSFIAEGRTPPESLIVFTSYRDDFYGGDTNNDLSATVPASSDWNYVTVDGTAIDPEVRFKNCVFRYGGSSTTIGALRCVNSSPSIDSCLVSYNRVGISVEGASNPTISGSSFFSNVYWAVNNSGNSFCVNAENNWWGASSGPNDASATADLCGLGSNPGTGDMVSNNVDYSPWITTGVQNPLLGDVSLNGQVLAYDASLVLQSVALLVTLNPLQELVADVSGAGGVTAFDASLILQYVAGLITAFPAASNGVQPAPPDVLAAREVVARAQGTFQVWLGEAVADGDSYRVPVHVSGSAPVNAVELLLANGSAAALSQVAAAGGALEAHAAGSGSARVAVASAQALGQTALELVFTPPAGGSFTMPDLAWSRVNETELSPTPVPAPTAPALSFLARPFPNPARTPVRFSLGIAPGDADAPARVTVFDLAGRVVRVLQDGVLGAGVHDVTWNLARSDGRTAPPGVYLVRARTKSFEGTQRLIVVR